MFDRKGFIAFVGSASGAMYASGLVNIEKTYGVDIDAEIARDNCVNLLGLIDADKKQLSDNDRHTRQNWSSHLKKYVEFKSKQPVETQKQRFVAWFKQQPQKKQPEKLYADATVNAATNLLQNGLQRLGVPGYQNVNCFTITDAEEFKELHAACYQAATAFDTNAGVGDFRNGLDFYLQFLTETDSASQMLKKIQFIIAHYKDNFETVTEQERYKWEAQQWYRDHWNIDAPDLAAMLKEAFSKAGNLLDSGRNSLPYSQICEFSEAEPERIRNAFSVLYDETKPLDERITYFRKAFQDSIQEIAQQNPDWNKNLSSFQDLHAVSVYLAFEYPEKYFIYKAKCYDKFTARVGYQEISTAKNFSIRKLENLDRLCNTIINIVSKDTDLMTLHTARLDSTCYPDKSLHFLAQDIIFYGSIYMPDELFESDDHYVTEGDEEAMSTKTTVGLNTILYGPPGTGKTYHTVIYAVAIIENKELETVKAEAVENYQAILARYNEYKSQGRIEFTTFHQSYGYEEFIEGIRPTVVDGEDTTNIQYSVQPGMFKKFCERAERPVAVHANTDDFGIAEDAAIWKVSLGGSGDNEIRTDCLENGYIRIGWEEQDGDAGGSRIMNALINRMQIGDIVFSCYSTSTIDAIGIVTGEYERREEYEDYRSFRKVNWLVKNIKEDIRAINGGKYMMQPTVCGLPNVSLSDVYKLIEKHQPAAPAYIQNNQNYVFIIDEINRGNISKIFGELITLIEEAKRVGKAEGMKTLLPYSLKPFGVPENVYIIGTMNTADRSIAAIDTALRRRFQFEEMMPNLNVVKDIRVGNLSIEHILDQMNRRIEVLYDREHTIGHAYFMPLKHNNTIAVLADIFKNKIVPLLQEYFYEDYEKIRLVLGDNQKEEKDQFIQEESVNPIELFGNAEVDLGCDYTYTINESAFMNPEAYQKI